MKRLIVFSVLFCGSYAIVYDAYRGAPATKREIRRFTESNILETCTVDFEPCNPKEGRRIDGSCNNLKHPSRGAFHSPANRRMLPERFAEGYEPVQAASGNDLPLARRVRTGLLSEGTVTDQKLTTCSLNFLLFSIEDTLSNHDIRRYVFEKTYCCLPEGETDHECVPNKIPDDDPVHRFSTQRCMNMTKPISFQSQGCTRDKTSPVRASFETPFFDLSVVYGNSVLGSQKFRAFIRGLLKVDKINGRVWPPAGNPAFCMLNQGPTETRCHDAPDPLIVNSLLGINLFFIYFWRMHNYIANELADVNECWDDDKIFSTARDINIAIHLQILYYEAMPLFGGRERLIKDGVLSSSTGFRDIYNKHEIPELSLEFPYAGRWFHTLQDSEVKLFDANRTHVGSVSIVDLTGRTGFLADGDNMVKLTHSGFMQGCAKADQVVDPIIAELGLGPLQNMLDISTNDISKSGYFGLESYITYREHCFGCKVTCWEDLLEVMKAESVEKLKNVYESVEDVEVLPGMFMEEPIPGGYAPPTWYCLTIDQMRRNIVTDRHWYERKSRPNAFKLPQLLEIRKMTISSLMCYVGDSVTQIQPKAFERIGKKNKLTSCCKIPKIDFSKWIDESCECETY